MEDEGKNLSPFLFLGVSGNMICIYKAMMDVEKKKKKKGAREVSESGGLVDELSGAPCSDRLMKSGYVYRCDVAVCCCCLIITLTRSQNLADCHKTTQNVKGKIESNDKKRKKRTTKTKKIKDKKYRQTVGLEKSRRQNKRVSDRVQPIVDRVTESPVNSLSKMMRPPAFEWST